MLSNAELLGPGIIVYRNTFTKDMNLINRLEETLSNSSDVNQWRTAKTGYALVDKKYRDCYDFKIKKNNNDDTGKSESTLKLEKIWEDARDAQIAAVEDYRKMFGLAPLNYWESFNFIKYGKDQHFDVHSDHGYSYICVLSSVGYLNDDYEGGELFFDKLNIKIKPKAGDLYLFPSSYIYSHAAMPVISGKKYSVVTMLDYLEAPHTPDYREIEKRYTDGYV
jgi:predicted 2-oxoglutarate/Fe(II)-dependent dioxygenase YbiX